MQKIIVILFLCSCGSIKTVESSFTKYPNGKIKSITKKTIEKNKGFELFENYRIEKLLVREYYSNGKLKYETILTHHNGADYPCREALYQLKQFDSLGVKRPFVKNECDCHKQIEITYNNKGKILTKWKKEVKRLY